jgi:hypothetical protein
MSRATIRLGNGKSYEIQNVTCSNVEVAHKPTEANGPVWANRPWKTYMPDVIEATATVKYVPQPDLFMSISKGWHGFSSVSVVVGDRRYVQDVVITEWAEDGITVKLIGEPRWEDIPPA